MMALQVSNEKKIHTQKIACHALGNLIKGGRNYQSFQYIINLF